MRRDLGGATPVGLGQPAGAAAEQIVRSARAPQQAILGGGMRLASCRRSAGRLERPMVKRSKSVWIVIAGLIGGA
jgi:hypothetical protein